MLEARLPQEQSVDLVLELLVGLKAAPKAVRQVEWTLLARLVLKEGQPSLRQVARRTWE
jgi:hypothetical protein